METTRKLPNWAETWRTAGPLLEAIEEEEWRRLDYAQIVGDTVEYDGYIARAFPPKKWSGLMLLQKLLKKRRHE